MKWLEIIELRSVEKDKKTLEAQIEKIFHEVEREFIGKSVRSYRRVLIETDFSIHLFHETENMETGGSEIGLRLVAVLRDFGLVNHSIWTETLY
jgi:hypothetical protein